MSDVTTQGFIANRNARDNAEREALMAELKSMAIVEQQPKQAAPATAPAAPQAAAPEKSKGIVGTTMGAGREAIAAGVYAGTGLWDSVSNMVYDAVDAASTMTFNHRFKFRSDLSGAVENLTGFKKPQTVGGQIGKELVQWAAPFTAALKAANTVTKATTTAGKFANATAAGAAADLTATTDNLSHLMVSMGNEHPWMKNFITEALATDPNDPDYMKRLKNVAEGGAMGASIEVIMSFGKMLKAANAMYRSKGVDPVQALEEASTKQVEESASATSAPTEPTPLQQRINEVTGVKEQKRNWQRYLDAQAAVRDAEAAKGPKAVVENAQPVKAGYQSDLMEAANKSGVEVQTPSRQLTPQEVTNEHIRAAMADHEAKLARGEHTHRVLVDEAGNIHLSKEAPDAGQVDLGEVVNKVLRPGYSKDLMKEAADVPIQTPSRELTVGERNQVEIDATMRKHLETYKALQEEALGKVKAVADEAIKTAKASSKEKAKAAPKKLEINDKAPEFKEGDTVMFNGGRESGDFVRHSKDGKVVVEDSMTGKIRVVTPDVEDALVTEIRANDKAIKEAAGKKIAKSQSGAVDPTVLAQIASGMAGGFAGFTNAPDDSTLADRLAMAGVFALGGAKLAKVGLHSMKTPEQAARLADEMSAAESLARPEVRNILPAQPNMKKPPVISRDKVDAIVQAAKTGDFDSMADKVRESDFNFDNIDTEEEVKTLVDSFSSTFEKEIDTAKHGIQTNRQLRELADELGAGMGSLKELFGDTNNLGARIYAHRALLVASAEKVNQLARLAQTGDADAILSMRKHVALHATIQAQMKGVQTEVGRALAQFRLKSTAVDLSINERNMLIEAMGGHKANADFAAKLAAISDPKRLNAIVRKSALARSEDALYEAWVNGLLSAPVTHAVNLVSNSLVALGAPIERFNAAMIGKARQALGSTEDTVEVGEAFAHMYGLIEGLKDTLRIDGAGSIVKELSGKAVKGDIKGAMEVLKDNQDSFGSTYRAFATDMPVTDNLMYGTKEFDSQGYAISSSNLVPTKGAISDVLDSTGMRNVAEIFTDTIGTVVRVPGRLLTTSDELFKSMHYRGELKAQAYRMAQAKGLKGEEFAAEVSRLVDDPTPELSRQALNAAREGTFTSPLGTTGSKFASVVRDTKVGRYIIPFMRTPVNIMKFVGVRTPGINLMAESVRNELRAGGVRRDMAMSKMVTGGALYGVGMYLASQGIIKGGGEKNRASENLGGQQQYSVQIAGKTYAFNRLDPYGMFIGLAADLSDIMGMLDESDSNDVATAAALALSRNITSKSYLSGIVKAIEAFDSNDGDKVDKWFRDMASSFVPAGVNAIRKEDDDVIREVWDMVDAIKNRLPGYSRDLPADLNIFGEEVHYKGGLGPDMVSPIRTTELSTQPAAQEIARLNIDLQKPPKSISVGKGAPPIDLNPKQYHRLMQLLGEGFKPAITELVKSNYYKDMPEDPTGSKYLDAKEMTIKLMYAKFQSAAVKQLLAEDKGLMDAYTQSMKNVGNIFTGDPLVPIEPQ